MRNPNELPGQDRSALRAGASGVEGGGGRGFAGQGLAEYLTVDDGKITHVISVFDRLPMVQATAGT
jgi:hypothetical protein